MTWQVRQLGEVCQVDYGTRVVQRRDGGTIYPVYGGGGETFKVDKSNREDQLIVSRFAMSEECVRFVAGKFFLNDSGLTVSSKLESLSQAFLDWQILYKRGEIYALGRGAAQRNLDIPAFLELQISYPSIVEQRRIVALLDEAFAGIATAKANAEKSMRNAREVFDGYMRDLFLCDTVSQLGELGAFRNGVNYTQRSKGRRVRIVGVKDFKDNFSVPLESLEAVQLDGELNPLDALRANDILFVRSNGNPGLIGRCLLMSGADEEISHSGFTIRFRLTDAGMNPKYLCQFLKTPATRRKLTESGTGTNIKSLNQQILSALPVPIPTGVEQMRVVMRIEEVSAEVSQLQSLYTRKIAALDKLKQSLLHRAFSGQL
ncbi:restriction endonuclease subunit S [Thermomonas paludicola]|uniref:restriction endonuclease subunit S n=1 Tax=Thermomonas paludicola TaxID=2884874 RepID=UPI0021142F48|nr:restriction endonuclease subunit S [Thermomonas paludicola]